MARKKIGKITMQVGAEPTESDILVANIFAKAGCSVEILAASKAYRVRTPDMNIDGVPWEVKCPKSRKSDKVRQKISDALGQSQNIIIGTFRSKMTDENILRAIDEYLNTHKRVKHLKVITKMHEIIDLK